MKKCATPSPLSDCFLSTYCVLSPPDHADSLLDRNREEARTHEIMLQKELGKTWIDGRHKSGSGHLATIKTEKTLGDDGLTLAEQQGTGPDVGEGHDTGLAQTHHRSCVCRRHTSVRASRVVNEVRAGKAG